MNVISVIGRLTRDPVFNVSHNEHGEIRVASFYLAVPRNYNKETNYIKVTAFGKVADFAHIYLAKGKRVGVTGELITGSYVDKENCQTVRTFEIVASKIDFADAREEGEPVDFVDIPPEIEKELPFK